MNLQGAGILVATGRVQGKRQKQMTQVECSLPFLVFVVSLSRLTKHDTQHLSIVWARRGH